MKRQFRSRFVIAAQAGSPLLLRRDRLTLHRGVRARVLDRLYLPPRGARTVNRTAKVGLSVRNRSLDPLRMIVVFGGVGNHPARDENQRVEARRALWQ